MRYALFAFVLSCFGCAGTVQLTLAPVVDTHGQGGALVRIGGSVWLPPPANATRVIAPHAAVDIGGLPGSAFPESRDAGLFGGARVGVRSVLLFPKWLLSIDTDFPVLLGKYRSTLVGVGAEVAFVPTVHFTGLYRRYGIGASVLSDVWGDPSSGDVRGVFGLGFVLSLVDFSPE